MFTFFSHSFKHVLASLVSNSLCKCTTQSSQPLHPGFQPNSVVFFFTVFGIFSTNCSAYKQSRLLFAVHVYLVQNHETAGVRDSRATKTPVLIDQWVSVFPVYLLHCKVHIHSWQSKTKEICASQWKRPLCVFVCTVCSFWPAGRFVPNFSCIGKKFHLWQNILNSRFTCYLFPELLSMSRSLLRHCDRGVWVKLGDTQ